MTITPPTTEYDDAPYKNVRFNEEWISHLIGLIDRASKEYYWTAGDAVEAVQQIELIIRALTLGNGVLYPNKRAIFRHQVAINTAGGTKVANAWTTLPIGASFYASPNTGFSVASNVMTVPDGYYRFDAHHVFRNASNYIARTRLVWARGGVIGDQVIGYSDVIKVDASPAINREIFLTTFYELTDGSNNLRFEYYSTVSRNSDGLGAAMNLTGHDEKYGEVILQEVFKSDAND